MSSLSDRILEAQRSAINNGDIVPQRQQVGWSPPESNPNPDQSQTSQQSQQQQQQQHQSQQQAMYNYDLYSQQQYNQMLMQQQMMGMQMGGQMMAVDPTVASQGMGGWQGQPQMMGMPMQGQNPGPGGPVSSLHQPGHPSHQLQNQQQQLQQMPHHQQMPQQQQQQQHQQQMAQQQQQMHQPGASHQFNGGSQGQQSGPPGSKGKGGGPLQPPPQETAPGPAHNMLPIPSPPHMMPNASMMQQPGGKGMGSQMSIGSSGPGGGSGAQGHVSGNMSLVGANQAPISGTQGPMGQSGPQQPQMMMTNQGMMIPNAPGQYGMQHMMMVPNNYMMQQQFPQAPPFEDDGGANVREDKRGMQPKQRPGGSVGRRDLALLDENHPARRPRDPTRESWADVTDSPKGASDNILLDLSDDRMNRKGGKDMGKSGKMRGKDNMGFGTFPQQGGPIPGGMGGFGPGGAPPPPIVPGGMMGDFGMDDRKLRQNLFDKQLDEPMDFSDMGKGKGKKSSKSTGQDSSGVGGKGKGGKSKGVDDFNFPIQKGKGSAPGKGGKQSGIPMQMLPRGQGLLPPPPPPHGRIDDFKGESKGFKGAAVKGSRKDKGFKGKDSSKGDKGDELMAKGFGGKKNKGGFGKQSFAHGGKFDGSPRKMMDRELTDWFALRMGGNGPEGSSGSQHPQGGKDRGSQQWKAKASPDDSQQGPQWKQKQGQDGDKIDSKKSDKDQTAKGRSKQNVKNEARNARQKEREQGSNADKESEKRTSGGSKSGGKKEKWMRKPKA